MKVAKRVRRAALPLTTGEVVREVCRAWEGKPYFSPGGATVLAAGFAGMWVVPGVLWLAHGAAELPALAIHAAVLVGLFSGMAVAGGAFRRRYGRTVQLGDLPAAVLVLTSKRFLALDLKALKRGELVTRHERHLEDLRDVATETIRTSRLALRGRKLAVVPGESTKARTVTIRFRGGEPVAFSFPAIGWHSGDAFIATLSSDRPSASPGYS